MIRLATLTLVAGTALVVPAAPSSAAPCSGSSGVTVVVDFASLGGGAQTRCAPGDPATGVDALRGAGFQPTRAAQQPGYFVCRIDGKPANDPCQRASPADAYWSYWYAAPGGSWRFSNEGAAERDPDPSTVEGWAFGAGRPPSVPPPRRAQPAPSSASPAAPSRGAPPGPSPASRDRTASAAPTVAPPGATRSPAPAAGSPTESPTASPTGARIGTPAAPAPSPTPADATPAAVGPVTEPEGPGGPPGGVLVAGLLVAGLVAAAARQTALRRRDR